MKTNTAVHDYLLQVQNEKECNNSNLPGQAMAKGKDSKQQAQALKEQRLELIKKRIEAGFYEQEEILREIAEEILKSGKIPKMPRPPHLKDKSLNWFSLSDDAFCGGAAAVGATLCISPCNPSEIVILSNFQFKNDKNPVNYGLLGICNA